MKQLIQRIMTWVSNVTEEGMLLKNAWRGWPNAQYELAIFYLKTKNYIEAYAWAEVVRFRNQPGAHEIKRQAESMIHPDKLKEAWDLARQYKQNYT